MKKPVRIGIVGCGVIAQYHAKALAGWTDAQIVAVADLREEAALRTAADFKVGKVYTDPHTLIADPEVDAVILALPANGRTELGIAAFRAGKHVLTEKPVAMNAQEVGLLMAAQGQRVGACCSSRHRFTETARIAAEFMASGALGKLRHLRCRALCSAAPAREKMPPIWSWSRKLNGGGVLMNWGCYDLDFFLGTVGWSLVPRQVMGSIHGVSPQFVSQLPPGSDAESHAIGFIMFDGNVTMAYERAEFYSGKDEAVWEISGAEGSLELALAPRDGPLLIHRHISMKGDLKEKVLWGGPDSWLDIHNGPVRDFVMAIRENRQPRTNLKQALVVAQISDAIYTSAATGKTVQIN